MQKMRVSAMKITKADGQRVEMPPMEISERRKESLKLRLRQIEKKYQAKREKESVERSAAASAYRPRRRTVLGRKPAPEGTGGTWRRDVMLQAGICAVVLLSVVGFRAIDTPVTNRISDGIAQAVTMDIDLSENLGELQFVKDVMPESVLAFWQGTADAPEEFNQPLHGEVAVPYTEKVAGVLLVGTDAEVYAAADGEVLSVKKGQDGDFILKLKHSGGVETVYGFLQGVKVAEGDRVTAGQNIGLAMPTNNGVQLYFQAIRDGKTFDPETMLPQ